MIVALEFPWGSEPMSGAGMQNLYDTANLPCLCTPAGKWKGPGDCRKPPAAQQGGSIAAVPPRTSSAAYAYAKTGSPAGTVHLLATQKGLAALYFDAQRAAMERRFPNALRFGGHGNIWLLRGEAFVACYFAGDIDFAPEIPLDLTGTEFQRSVWSALREIPPATTVTYGRIAHRVRRPAAVRAVGAAVGQNPVSIYIPCHRVVGSNGDLTGYAGGIEVKRLLLDHEKAHRAG